MPRRNLRACLTLFSVSLAVLVVLSCSDDSVPRSVVTIDSINNNESLDSDVYNNGDDGERGTDDDTIYEDQVPIIVRNRPHDSALTIRANGPFGAVVFSRYQVTFDGDEALPVVDGSMYLRVQSGATVTGEITVIPVAYKYVPPLIGLRQGGEIRLNAYLTLYGEEEDSHHEVVVKGILGVHCADWADPE